MNQAVGLAEDNGTVYPGRCLWAGMIQAFGLRKMARSRTKNASLAKKNSSLGKKRCLAWEEKMARSGRER
jgi:hypothetical protein